MRRRRLAPRSPKCAPSPSGRAPSPAWMAWSSASNTSWRTRTPLTNSAAMSLPKMANAVPTHLQDTRGKTGGWWHLGLISLSLSVDVQTDQRLFAPQSDLLCRTRSQEHHGSPCSDEEVSVQSIPRDPAVPAQLLQPSRDARSGRGGLL